MIVYVPRQYEMDDEHLRRFLAQPRAGDLVTVTPHGPEATLLPVVYHPDDGPHGSFIAHMSRVNPQWRAEIIGEALLILTGPHAFMTTRWMPDVLAAGTAIPTWNYLSVHAYGRLVIHDDEQWACRAAAELAELLEPGYDVDALPEPYRSGQLRAIVGIELQVTRVVAKAKLSQNRSLSDLAEIVAGLRDAGLDELATETEQIACPYAARRDEVVTQAAANRDRPART
ncbi:FMN-binding negative transcriptional regulator [Propionicicella superfundia]|uniref:FMN-binding negative transcriptional regulator n=1 Tax=Propionicicella superfundia TaxID=348582 RepID=UPI00040EB98D|nr:FMN-binding negative transcriptional regulator [Propionicicella superfundia]